MVAGPELDGRRDGADEHPPAHEVQPLLDAVVQYLPSPLDVPPVTGTDPKTGEELVRRPNDDDPFSALAFKIASDPFVGKLAFFRVYSGVLRSGDTVMNATKDKKERI
ncbi:MAG: hypothetical protein ABR611_16190, partial [Chthoniobacterales bacterium]